MVERISTHHFTIGSNIAIEGLKSLILVNGGAATALIALTGSTTNAPDYSLAVIFFGAGAVLSVMSFAAAYFSQLSYANHCLEYEKENGYAAASALRGHHRYQNITLTLVALSITVAFVGICLAFLSAASASQCEPPAQAVKEVAPPPPNTAASSRPPTPPAQLPRR